MALPNVGGSFFHKRPRRRKTVGTKGRRLKSRKVLRKGGSAALKGHYGKLVRNTIIAGADPMR